MPSPQAQRFLSSNLLLEHRDALGISVFFGLVYFLAVAWGLPDGSAPDRVAPWGHDSIAPLAPLAEMYGVLIEAPENPFLGYPLLQHMLLCAAYAPYLAYLLVTGGFENPSGGYPFGLIEPGPAIQTLTLIARSVTVLMAVGLLLGVRDIGRTLFGPRAGVFGAVFVGVLYPMVYYSRTGNLDVPSLMWCVLGVATLARIARLGFTTRRAITLGLFAACAAGTKDQNAALFLLMPFVLVPVLLQAPATSTRNRWQPLGWTLASGALAYVITSGLFLSPSRWWHHVLHILGIGDTPIVLPGHPATSAGYVATFTETFGWLEVGAGLPLLLLAAVGVIRCARHDRQALLVLGLPALSVILFFVVPTRLPLLRYLLGILIFAGCFAALPIARGFASPRRGVRIATLAAALLAVAVPAGRGVELTHAQWNDSRIDAARYIERESAADESVGFFGPDQKLPRVDRRLVRLDRFIGTRQGTTYTDDEIDGMIAFAVAAAPDWIVLIPDHTILPGLPDGITVPPALARGLRDGSLGFDPVARFETPPLAFDRPRLVRDYEIVNPPVEVFRRTAR